MAFLFTILENKFFKIFIDNFYYYLRINGIFSGAFLKTKNRTFYNSVKSPILLLFKWSGRRDSNSRQPAWKADALPTELLPHEVFTLQLLSYNKKIGKSRLLFKEFYIFPPDIISGNCYISSHISFRKL